MNKTLKLVLINLIILLVLQEVVLRICFPVPEVENFNRSTYQLFHQKLDKVPFLRNIKRGWTSLPDTNYTFVYNLNQYGYRDKFWTTEKTEGKTRFIFVGDSFTEGMMANEDETIVAGFEKFAKAQGQTIETMNCGMMGIGINEYIKFLSDALPLFKPDHVILALYSNDIQFNETYVPEQQFVPVLSNSFVPRLSILLDQIEKDDPIPFRWSSEIEPYYLPVPDPSNPLTNYANQFTPHVKPELLNAMRQGKFNFYRMNWAIQEANFLRSPWDNTQRLEIVKNLCQQNDAELTIFYIPSRVQVTEYYHQFDKQSCLQQCPDRLNLTGPEYRAQPKELASTSQKLGIRFYDLTADVEAEEARGNHLYWNYDDHMRGKGYTFLASNMWKFWSSEFQTN